MIDLHCHILPKMDDGAKSTEMSVAMLEEEARAKVDTVVLTPHFYLEQESPESFFKRRQSSYQRLLDVTKDGNYPNLRLGTEVLFTTSLLDMDMRPFCIEGTDYLLLELPYKKLDKQLLMQIHRFIDSAGVRIIIAHIERYLRFTDEESVKQIMGMDVLCQVNADNFLKASFLRKKLIRWIERNYVQLLGTDAHNTTTRAVNISEAYDYISKKLGDVELVKNAQRVLDNEDVY